MNHASLVPGEQKRNAKIVSKIESNRMTNVFATRWAIMIINFLNAGGVIFLAILVQKTP
jgi:hypothetical protein